MSDWNGSAELDRHIRREREKARQLRRTQFWQKLLQKGVCHYCGGHFPPGELTMDHIVPLARGGAASKATSCSAANSATVKNSAKPRWK